MSEPAIVLLMLGLGALLAATVIAVVLFWLVLGSPVAAWAKLLESMTLLIRELQRRDAMRVTNAAGAWGALLWIVFLAVTAHREDLLQNFIMTLLLLVVIIFYHGYTAERSRLRKGALLRSLRTGVPLACRLLKLAEKPDQRVRLCRRADAAACSTRKG